jgi:signal transduction histidine kinase
MAIQKNVRILKNFPENAYYQADSSEIEIIFNNLISNAVKYNNDNGQVEISIIQFPKALTIIVEDNGIGMSKEDSEKLFEDFVRIKNEKTKSITGSGLGLSITKKIINLYNGAIHVESEPGKGTKFTIELPHS